MRAAYCVLLTYNILSAPWTLFLHLMLPMGGADRLHGQYRADLAAEIGFDRATHFTGIASQIVGSTTQWTVILVGLPALALNAGWAILALLALRAASAKRDVGETRTPPGA